MRSDGDIDSCFNSCLINAPLGRFEGNDPTGADNDDEDEGDVSAGKDDNDDVDAE